MNRPDFDNMTEEQKRQLGTYIRRNSLSKTLNKIGRAIRKEELEDESSSICEKNDS